MNTLSKIRKVLILASLFSFMTNGYCQPRRGGTSIEVFLFALADSNRETDRLRLLNEPNNDFESAKCVDNSIQYYIYPSDDLDFYKVTLQSGSLRLYIYDYENFPVLINLGMQIYDESQKLIYDLNQRSFDVTNATITINRNLSANECMISKCSALEKYRYIEFNSSKTKLFIKFYSLNQEKFATGHGGTFPMDKIVNPTNTRDLAAYMLNGNFAPCL